MPLIDNPQKTEETFQNCWQDAIQEIGEAAPYATDLTKIDYKEFIEKVNSNNNDFIKDFVFSFYRGTVYIFTDTFQCEVLKIFKEQVFEWSQKCGFSDTSEGDAHIEDYLPDLISARDWHFEDHGFGYSSTYDMIHFFRWNGDPLGAYDLFDEPFRLLHAINAVNIRKTVAHGQSNVDKVTDRIEISRYSPMKGGIAFHTDPVDATRFTFTVNLTQFGVDYKSGGFGVGLGGGKILQIDPLLEMGSMVGFLPKVCHGVEIIDPHGASDPNQPESVAGRWYAGLTMINLEKSSDRQVTTPDLAYPTLREQISVFNNKQSP